MRRHRLTWDKTAARAPSGMYGYTKKVQADCEGCVRKLDRHATSLVKSAYGKDERIVAFLQTHAKRSKSSSARVLLSALKASAPRIAGKGGKVAASKTYGLYGFPSNTVKLGLAMCSQLREQAGLLTASLHARRVAKHERITTFFKTHSKKARCYSSRMLLAGYPDADAKYASAGSKTAGADDSKAEAAYRKQVRKYLQGTGRFPSSRGLSSEITSRILNEEQGQSKTAADSMVTAGVDEWLAWDDGGDDLSHYG